MESAAVSYIQRELEFVRFLLVCNKHQASLLLRHLTPQQTNAIGEIFFNVLYSQDLDEDLLSGLKRHRTLIRRIGDRQKGVISRRKDIAKHSATVLRILQLVEVILPETVRDV